MSLSRKELLGWCALSALLLAAIAIGSNGPRFRLDSYEYLSAAENIRAGRGAATSIINFDVERRSGHIPAPLTTFPPGYSFAIAQLDRIGLDGEQAGALVSMLSFIALFPFLAWGARVIHLGAMSTRVVFAGLLANSWMAVYPLSIQTESTFTALTTGAVVALMAAERRGQTAPRRTAALLLGSVLVGLSYWVRYAGLFLFGTMVAYFALKLLVRRDRRSASALAFCAVPLGIIGIGVARNIVLTSSWQGGNTKSVLHPLASILPRFVAAIYRLFFGERGHARFGAAELLFAVAAVALASLGVHALRERLLFRVRHAHCRTSLALLFGYLVVYSAGMIYAGTTSVISFGTRMFYPLLPLLLLAVGHVLDRIAKAASTSPRRRPVLLGATALLSASYLVSNARSFPVEPDERPDRVLDARFAAPAADGRPLRSWMEENVPPDATIVTTEAHATAYALKRKTVALVEREYTEINWSESEVLALMQSYGAEVLTLYPTDSSSASSAQRESPFLAGLLEGRTPPWLTLAAENQHVKVFRRLPAYEALGKPSADSRVLLSASPVR